MKRVTKMLVGAALMGVAVIGTTTSAIAATGDVVITEPKKENITFKNPKTGCQKIRKNSNAVIHNNTNKNVTVLNSKRCQGDAVTLKPGETFGPKGYFTPGSFYVEKK